MINFDEDQATALFAFFLICVCIYLNSI